MLVDSNWDFSAFLIIPMIKLKKPILTPPSLKKRFTPSFTVSFLRSWIREGLFPMEGHFLFGAYHSQCAVFSIIQF